MTTEKTLAADVQQRAKALEDWAISTLGNTTERSSEADQALRHHGTKGLRGRPFSFTVGDADPNALLMIHGRIETILVSKNRPTRSIVLVQTNPMYHDGNGLAHAVLTIVQHTESHRSTGWVLAVNDWDCKAELADDDKPVVTLTIE